MTLTQVLIALTAVLAASSYLTITLLPTIMYNYKHPLSSSPFPHSPTLYTRPSDNKINEYYTLFSPLKNNGRERLAVVLIHSYYNTGWSMCRVNSGELQGVMKKFGARDVQIVCPSLPGFGLSDPLPQTTTDLPSTLSAFTSDTLNLLHTQNLTSAIIVGLGSGADVALHLAASLSNDKDDDSATKLVGTAVISPLPWEGEDTYKSAEIKLTPSTVAMMNEDNARVLSKSLWSLLYPETYTESTRVFIEGLVNKLESFGSKIDIINGRESDEEGGVGHVVSINGIPSAVERILAGTEEKKKNRR